MGNKVLEIEKGWKLGFSLETILVFVDDKKINIPINDINIVLINNISTNMSIKLLNELANRNILVIFCNEKHMPNCFLLPISGHYNSLKKIQEQIMWDDNFKSKKWKQILNDKINAQCLLLHKLELYNEVFDELIVKNVDWKLEAQVAAKYFKILYGKSFERRNEDTEYNTTVNSFLNYGYTILLSIVTRSIIKNGYDTRIALFHKSFSNHTALASDIMEPFRPIVDKCVFTILREIRTKDFYLDSDIKKKLIDLFTLHIIYNNERINISQAIDKYVYDVLDTNNNISIEYLYNEY